MCLIMHSFSLLASHLQPQETTDLTAFQYYKLIYVFENFLYMQNTICNIFLVCLLLLSIIMLRFIHVVVYIFRFIAEWCSVV